MSASYRVLEDVALADIAFDAQGATPAELCQAAAQAVIDILADPSTVGTTWHREVTCESDSFAELLFDWLNELVFLKDAEAVVFHRVALTVDEQGGQWRLRAQVTGAPIDASSQTLHVDIKAVTKHLYAVTQAPDGWQARVVLDV